MTPRFNPNQEESNVCVLAVDNSKLVPVHEAVVVDPEITTALRQYIRESFLFMHPDRDVGDDEDLFATGIVDSLGVMELVGFLEDRWGLEVKPAHITTGNFGCVGSMANYITEQRGQ